MRRPVLTLLLGAALFPTGRAATPNTMTVWVPEWRQSATVSAAGLKLADGRSLSPQSFWQRGAYGNQTLGLERGAARLTEVTGQAPARLEVLDHAGRVTATQTFPEARRGSLLRVTARGPCVTSASEELTRCFSPDLKTEWAKLDWVLSVTQDGKAAYLYDAAKNGSGAAYTPNLHLIRQNLTTGEHTPLTYRVPLDEEELEYHRNIAATYEVGDSISFGAELPGGRFVVCASMTMPKMGCRLDIVERDLKRLTTLQGSAYVGTPSATADGKRLYFMGNTLQVWDAGTGQRLSAIRDPLWEKRGQYPLTAYLTPDGTQAAILVTGLKNGHADHSKITAYVYRVQGGKLLNSFAVKP